MVGVASSVANDVTMRMGAASAASAVGPRRHNENDVTMTIAGLWRYGDWRHVATGCTTLLLMTNHSRCWQPATERMQVTSSPSVLVPRPN